MLGVAAVDVVAGEPGAVAKVLATTEAIATFAAGPTQPGNPDSIADSEALRPLPRPDDTANDLVSRNKRQLRLRQLTIEDVEVGATNATGVD